MGRGRLPFLRVLGLSVLLLTAGLLSAKPAQADPHGVFFTVVGQQQIFFNILAALNQADYVEPLQLRQQLAQARNTAGYVPSSDARLTSTATQLAEVLTRDVSLEGQDVRTQERSDEYAREVVRQQRVAELIKKLCQEAFGAKDCTGEVEPQPLGASGIPLTGREQSFVQDPVTRSKLPFILGTVGALLSGTEAHTEFANRLLDEAERGGAVLPFEYSPEIAAWRKAASAEEAKKLDQLILDAAASFLNGGLDPGFWQDIKLTGDGGAEIEIGSSIDGKPVTPLKVAEKSLRSFQTLLTMRPTLNAIAREAEQRVSLQLNSTVVDGAVPDLAHVIDKEADETPKRISTLVTAPANVKVGLQQQLLVLLTQLEGDPVFADPAQIDKDGGETAVDRQDKDALKIGTPLAPFQKADVIDKGLLPNTGVTARAGLNRLFLKEFIDGCLRGLCETLLKP